MIKELLQPEVVNWGLFLTPFLMALTAKQKAWTRKRDGNKCRFPEKHDCNGEKKTLHVHHIKPQRYCEKFGVDPDYPENVISVCENAHVGNGTNTPDMVIHPDAMQARNKYREGNKGAFKDMAQVRDHLLDERQIYWNDTWDRVLGMLAVILTQKFDEPWPENGSRKQIPDSYQVPKEEL